MSSGWTLPKGDHLPQTNCPLGTSVCFHLLQKEFKIIILDIPFRLLKLVRGVPPPKHCPIQEGSAVERSGYVCAPLEEELSGPVKDCTYCP